jgi:hypothetical protein
MEERKTEPSSMRIAVLVFFPPVTSIHRPSTDETHLLIGLAFDPTLMKATILEICNHVPEPT